MNNSRVRALLISNSTNHGQGYLDHVESAILAFLKGIKRIVFVPYALKDWAAYTEKARARFGAMGIELISVDNVVQKDTTAAKLWAPLPDTAIFVGGATPFGFSMSLREAGICGRSLIR